MSIPKEFLVESFESKEAEELVANENPSFFKITKNNKSLHLLGSRHQISFSILHPKSKKIIKESSCLVCEALGNNGSSDTYLPRLEDEPVWSSYLPEEFVSFLTENLKHGKLGKHAELDDLSCYTLGILAEFGLHLIGMDQHVEDYFRKNDKPIYSLDKEEVELVVYPEEFDRCQRLYENIKRTIEIMRKCKKDEQLYLYKEILNKCRKTLDDCGEVLNVLIKHTFCKELEEIDSMRKEYLEGNLELCAKKEDEDKNFFKVGERNYSWLPKIFELHQREQKSFVVVVGAGHLGGKYGLLNLLKESGFKIERMNNEGVFEHFGNYNPEGTLAERLVLQEEAYRVLSNQILGVSRINPLIWSKSYQDQIAQKDWEKCVEKYNKKYPMKEDYGYGAGAVIAYNGPNHP
ncbi:MAG TPA: TraB/GumN family protein [Gammaproteobacteria bacterium]|nr:TraB/GumN family protein [Gammaproteobacteria bacterium]